MWEDEHRTVKSARCGVERGRQRARRSRGGAGQPGGAGDAGEPGVTAVVQDNKEERGMRGPVVRVAEAVMPIAVGMGWVARRVASVGVPVVRIAAHESGEQSAHAHDGAVVRGAEPVAGIAVAVVRIAEHVAGIAKQVVHVVEHNKCREQTRGGVPIAMPWCRYGGGSGARRGQCQPHHSAVRAHGGARH